MLRSLTDATVSGMSRRHRTQQKSKKGSKKSAFSAAVLKSQKLKLWK
jgi:hypothetical protein